MDSVQALIRRTERDVAVIESVWHARESMKLIHQRLMELGGNKNRDRSRGRHSAARCSADVVGVSG
jgi:hypothetical protein